MTYLTVKINVLHVYGGECRPGWSSSIQFLAWWLWIGICWNRFWCLGQSFAQTCACLPCFDGKASGGHEYLWSPWAVQQVPGALAAQLQTFLKWFHWKKSFSQRSQSLQWLSLEKSPSFECFKSTDKEISEKDHVNFDDLKLKSFRSWDADEEAPRNQPLPRGPKEHEKNARWIWRFCHWAQSYPMNFKARVGRGLEADD